MTYAVKYANQVNQLNLQPMASSQLDTLFALLHQLNNRPTETITLPYHTVRSYANTWHMPANDYTRHLLTINEATQRIHMADKPVQPLFSQFTVNPTKRTVTVKLNPSFVSLFDKVPRRYTRLNLTDYQKLRSRYAKEAYRQLMQYRTQGVWVVSLKNFRRLLNVPATYDTSNLINYVLNPIVKELAPLIGLTMKKNYWHTPGRRGRGVLNGFEFHFDPQKTARMKRNEQASLTGKETEALARIRLTGDKKAGKQQADSDDDKSDRDDVHHLLNMGMSRYTAEYARELISRLELGTPVRFSVNLVAMQVKSGAIKDTYSDITAFVKRTWPAQYPRILKVLREPLKRPESVRGDIFAPQLPVLTDAKRPQTRSLSQAQTDMLMGVLTLRGLSDEQAQALVREADSLVTAGRLACDLSAVRKWAVAHVPDSEEDDEPPVSVPPSASVCAAVTAFPGRSEQSKLSARSDYWNAFNDSWSDGEYELF